MTAPRPLYTPPLLSRYPVLTLHASRQLDENLKGVTREEETPLVIRSTHEERREKQKTNGVTV